MPQSLTRSRGSQISGVLYIDVDGRPFPEPGWFNSVVAVLHGWVQAVLDLPESQAVHRRLYFMDGPFAIDIDRKRSTYWEVRCLRTDTDLELHQVRIDTHQLIAAMSMATACLLQECGRRGWTFC